MQPDSGAWIDSIDPYRGEPWARIAQSNATDAARAVDAAHRAMTRGPWADMTTSERGNVLRRSGDPITPHADQLIETEIRDNGKLLAEVTGQMKAVADCWYYYAGLADKIEGASILLEKVDSVAFTRREPVGVVAALTAWNSPLWFATVKPAPAMAAGCTVVIKPSEYASVSTLELAGLLAEAGVPDGVFNVVTGLGPDLGALLVEHRKVAKIALTGSDTTGAKLYETAARNVKRVSLELGGKSPNIVFEDADLDLAAVGVVSGIFGAGGQMCAASSRLLVHSSIKEQFLTKVVELAKDIRLGDPMGPATNISPISTPAQYDKVLRYIDVAKPDGARCMRSLYASTLKPGACLRRGLAAVGGRSGRRAAG
nr:aldehyde dehydrogenase family protein [Streptomyces albidoflavus]